MRYQAILGAPHSYFLELDRYVVPPCIPCYKCGAADAMIGKATPPTWLTGDDRLTEFGKKRARARRKY